MNKLSITVLIGLLTTAFSIGGAWMTVSLKAAEIDKLKPIVEVVDKKVVAIETKLESITEALEEQKIDIREQRNDIKEILKAVKNG